MKFIEFRIILFIASWTMLHGYVLRGRNNELLDKHAVITDNDKNLEDLSFTDNGNKIQVLRSHKTESVDQLNNELHVESDVETDKDNNQGMSVNSKKTLKHSININPVETLGNTFKHGNHASKKIGGLTRTAIETGKKAIVSATQQLRSIISNRSKVTIDSEVKRNVNRGVGNATGLKESSGKKNIQVNENGHHQYETNHNHELSGTASESYQTALPNLKKLVILRQPLSGGPTGMNVVVNSKQHQHEESVVNYNQKTTGFSGHGFQADRSKFMGQSSSSSPEHMTVISNENGHHQYETNHIHELSGTASGSYQTALPNLKKLVILRQPLSGGPTGMNVVVNSKQHQHEESVVNYNQKTTGFSGHGFQADRSKFMGQSSSSSPEHMTVISKENGHHQYETNHNHELSGTASESYQTALPNLKKLVILRQPLSGGPTGMNVVVNSKQHQHEESVVNYNQKTTGFSGHGFQADRSKFMGQSSSSSPEHMTVISNENGHHQYETNHIHELSGTASGSYQTALPNLKKLVILRQPLSGGPTGMNVVVNSKQHEHEESVVNYNQKTTGFSGHGFQADRSKFMGQSSSSSPEHMTVISNENGHHQYETNHNHELSGTASESYQTALPNLKKLVILRQPLSGGPTGMNVVVNSKQHQHEESGVNYNQKTTGFSGHGFQADRSKFMGQSSSSSPEHMTVISNENGHHQYETNHIHELSGTASGSYQTALPNLKKLVILRQPLSGGPTGMNVVVNSKQHQHEESVVNYNQKTTGFSGHGFQADRSKFMGQSSSSSPEHMTVISNENGHHQYETNHIHELSGTASGSYQTALPNLKKLVILRQPLSGGPTGMNVVVNSKQHQHEESGVNYNQKTTGFSGHGFQADRSKFMGQSSSSSPEHMTVISNENGHHQYETNHIHELSGTASGSYQTALPNLKKLVILRQPLSGGPTGMNVVVNSKQHQHEESVVNYNQKTTGFSGHGFQADRSKFMGQSSSSSPEHMTVISNENGHHQYETNHIHELSGTASGSYQTALPNLKKLVILRQPLSGGPTGMNVVVNSKQHQHEESVVNYNQKTTGFSGHGFQADRSKFMGQSSSSSPEHMTVISKENGHHQYETNHNHELSGTASESYQTALPNLKKLVILRQPLSGGPTGMNVVVNSKQHQHEESVVNYNQKTTGFSGHGFQADRSKFMGQSSSSSPEHMTVISNENGHHQYETNHIHELSGTASGSYQTALPNLKKLVILRQPLSGGPTGMNVVVNSKQHEHEESVVNYNQKTTGFSGHGFQADRSKFMGQSSSSSPEHMTVISNENGHHQYETNHNHELSGTASESYQTALPNLKKLVILRQPLSGGPTGMNVVVNSKQHQHEESGVNYNQKTTGFSGHGFQADRSKFMGQSSSSSPEHMTVISNENGHHQYETNHIHELSGTASGSYQTALPNLKKLVILRQPLSGGPTGMNVVVNSKQHQHEESVVNYNQKTTGFSGHGFQADRSKFMGQSSSSSPEHMTVISNENGHHQYETNHIHELSGTASGSYQTALPNLKKLVILRQPLSGGPTGMNVVVNSKQHEHEESVVNYNQKTTGFSGHGFQADRSKFMGQSSSSSPEHMTVISNENGHHQYETNHNHELSGTASESYQTALPNLKKLVILRQPLSGGPTGMNVVVNSKQHQHEESGVNYNQKTTGFSGHGFQADRSKFMGQSSSSSPEHMTVISNENGHHQYETNHNHELSGTASESYQTALPNLKKLVILRQPLSGGPTVMNVVVNSKQHQHEESVVNYNQKTTGFSGHGFQADRSKFMGQSSSSSPEHMTVISNENGHHQYETNHIHELSGTASGLYQTALPNLKKLVILRQPLSGGPTRMNVVVNSKQHQHEESVVNYNQKTTGFSGHGFQADRSKFMGQSSSSSPEHMTVISNENGHHQYETNHNHELSGTASESYQTALPNLKKLVILRQPLSGGPTGMNVVVNSKQHQHEESVVNYNQKTTGFSGHGFQADRSKFMGQSSSSSPEHMTVISNENGHHQYETNHIHELSGTASGSYQTALTNLKKLVIFRQPLSGGPTGMNVVVNSKQHQHEESVVNYNQKTTGFSGHGFQADRSKFMGQSSSSSPEHMTVISNENGHHQYETNHIHELSGTVSGSYQTASLNLKESGLSRQSQNKDSVNMAIDVRNSFTHNHHIEDNVELKNNLNLNSEGILHKPSDFFSSVAGKVGDLVKSAASTRNTRAQSAGQLLKNGITIKGEISLNHKADNHVSSSYH
ncbi:uncharacterized protein LOC130672677 [Microplitis mediator]|uniref:uncharacterized protein LOC130672677 n=1 Tax=Microplitis mediator TaxID=375433 RepID=UPI0025565020|nr:uncharacterized protein LOC130672677 [Microplitis mediator]